MEDDLDADLPSGSPQLTELFERVSSLLGGSKEEDDVFRPRSPETLQETGLRFEEVERLILKFLLAKGSATGRGVCAQIRLPFQIVDPILKQLKQDQVVTFKGTAEMGDYEFGITDYGRDRARRYSEECTYYGSAPVTLFDYLKAMENQSIAKQEATEEDLKNAFSDLIISEKMFERLGPAHQFRARNVSVWRAGKRKNEYCGTNYALFRLDHLDPTFDRHRGRPHPRL